MTELLQRVENSIRNRRLFRSGEKILVAVSGGLDSMTLLRLLHELSAKFHWKLVVAHFNHQLRGRSSDADERLVRKTAGAMKLPFVAGCGNVKTFAAKSKLSIEMAARKLRHEFLVRVAKQRKVQAIALAHHADDQVELFFLRLLRGAGGDGLAGMKWRSPSPVNPKIILVRPLLRAGKDELRRFARANEIHLREDATNATVDAPRNRVRNKLLPLLRRHYQPALNQAVLRLMEIVGAEADFCGEAARQWLDDRGRKSDQSKNIYGRLMWVGAVFESLPPAIQRRILQMELAGLDVAANFDLIETLRLSANLQVNIGPNRSLSRDESGKVSLYRLSTTGFKMNQLEAKLVERAGEVEFDGVRASWRFTNGGKFSSGGGSVNREFFDADKVGSTIVLRHWRPGDRFQPIGMKTATKLQDLFTNQKIPQARRQRLIIAESGGGEIFWVEGLRISEKFKVLPWTKRCLVWSWRPLAGFPDDL